MLSESNEVSYCPIHGLQHDSQHPCPDCAAGRPPITDSYNIFERKDPDENQRDIDSPPGRGV